MNILLSTLNAKYIHSSLALRYLKAYSQKDFPEIKLAEYSIKEPMMNILSDIYAKQPDVIGFSCYIWNIEETIALVKNLKKVKPETKIVLGGPEVSYDIAYWFNRVEEIDVIVMGEGEVTLHQLLKAIQSGTSLMEVAGIAFRDEKKHVQINSSREKANLDQLPSPYGNQEDIQSLTDKIVYYEASRGCPFSCAYCLSSIETGVRYFSIERVKEELLRLINSGVKTIKFVDRTFNTNKKFALEIFEFLIQNHKETVFQFEITADIMKEEVLDYLIEHAPAGVFRFEIGVQSTNEYTNSLIKRRQDFQKLSQTVLALKNTKRIDQHLDLIAGLPEEDYESFRKTFNDVFALRPEELQLGFLKMLRGTELWLRASEYGYEYMEKAPYEILKNKMLSFDEVIRIKRVEDVLEKYWNAHRMDHTIEYLIQKEFNSPFDFFQTFGDYWEEQGWNRIGHQLEALFVRLLEFLEAKQLKNPVLAKDLMKLDYFLNHKYKPRKTWWEFKLTKQMQHQMIQSIIDQPKNIKGNIEKMNITEKDLHKHMMMESIHYDLFSYLHNGEIIEQETMMFIYYDQEEANVFFKTLDN